MTLHSIATAQTMKAAKHFGISYDSLVNNLSGWGKIFEELQTVARKYFKSFHVHRKIADQKIPSRCILLKVNNGSTCLKHLMSKIWEKMTIKTNDVALVSLLLTDFIHYSGVSNVDFDQDILLNYWKFTEVLLSKLLMQLFLHYKCHHATEKIMNVRKHLCF